MDQTAEKPVVVLKAARGWVGLNLDEVWEYRELIWILAKREVSSRYRQTAVGVLWAVLQPVMTMIICALVFGKMAKFSSDGVPYPLFCFAGMLPWQYFSASVNNSSGSLAKNLDLLTKVYFPRLCMPIAATLPPMVDSLAGFVVLLMMMMFFGVWPTWRILLLPVFLFLACICSLSVGLIFSAMSVKFRDLHHVLPFVIQLWMFGSPVVYSAEMVPAQYRALYALNPLSSIITGFRWCILDTGMPAFTTETAISSIVTFVLLVFGAYNFRRMERSFADFL